MGQFGGCLLGNRPSRGHSGQWLGFGPNSSLRNGRIADRISPGELMLRNQGFRIRCKTIFWCNTQTRSLPEGWTHLEV